MNITPKPIPAHKLPSPSGTDPAYLASLCDNAIEQMMLADDDARLPYFEYIETVKREINKAFS